jgi:hypothetical protein
MKAMNSQVSSNKLNTIGAGPCTLQLTVTKNAKETVETKPSPRWEDQILISWFTFLD